MHSFGSKQFGVMSASNLSLLSLAWAFIWNCFYSWESVIVRHGEGVILKNKVFGFHPTLLVCGVDAHGDRHSMSPALTLSNSWLSASHLSSCKPHLLFMG